DLHPRLSPEKVRVRAATVLPRFTPPPPDVRTDELERIVDHVRRTPVQSDPVRELRRLKVRALVLFLFRTGVRVSELCALRRQDIDLGTKTARIYRAKGGKSRTVHFDQETADALAAYWRARGDGGRGIGAYPAFSGRDRPGHPGKGIAPRTVQALVSRLCAEAGVEYPVTPHSFRHGLATELVRRRVRESTVQALLGHASPVTTRIYVHLTAQEAADEYHAAFGSRGPARAARVGEG
ncbi:MAG: site-specific integrase, partial [Thermomicrobium sp.]|nr:site-specific integrase [Thermomicrobium sp.]